MSSKFLLGLDIGTGGAKGLLVSPEGKVTARATAGYPLHTPKPGWAEQSPTDWWEATLMVLRELSRRAEGEIVGIVSAMSEYDKFDRVDVRLLQMMGYDIAIALQRAAVMDELRVLNESTIRSLARAVEARDPYTLGHSERVAEISVLLGRRMGLDEEKLIDHFVLSNSLGVTIPLSFVRVVDEDGRDVPADGKTPGRILFEAPSVTREYYKEPEKTKHAWRFGAFDVDDYVVMDEHGCIMFVDRAKDAIKSGGEWIPSTRLEGFISTHPAVAEAAAIGVSHPKWVERPIALVVLKPEYKGKVTEEDIINHLMKHHVETGEMPKWWIPDKIIFMDELPKTSTGKIDKKVLREKYKE